MTIGEDMFDKPSCAIQPQPPLSRQKLLTYLKAQYIDKKALSNNDMYLYATGRNSLADNMLISIINGEFDEVKEK